MSGPQRKFSTILPSVASLRANFEKSKGQQQQLPTPLQRIPSAQLRTSGSYQSLSLKTANSQPALVTKPASGNNINQAPQPVAAELTSPVAEESAPILVAQPPPSLKAADSRAGFKPNLETTLEEINDGASVISGSSSPGSGRRVSTKEPNTPAPTIIPPLSLNNTNSNTNPPPSPMVGAAAAARKYSIIPEPPPPTNVAAPNHDNNGIPHSTISNIRKYSVLEPPPIPPTRTASSDAQPPPTPPPQPPPQPPPTIEAPVKQLAVVAPKKPMRSEGILYCNDGYSRTLDAMRYLSKEMQVMLGKKSFLDPTNCKSKGMLDFLENCEAIFAFVESGIVSPIVRLQISLAGQYNKKILLFQPMSGHAAAEHDREMMDQLCVMLSLETKAKTKAEWVSLLSKSLVPFVFAPQSDDRRVFTLSKIESLLNNGQPAKVFASAARGGATPAPASAAFFLHGFNSDETDRLSIEFMARGQPCYAGDTLISKCTAAIFCMPSKQDELAKEQYSAKQIVFTGNARECRARNLAFIGLAPSEPSAWVPEELEGLVLAYSSTIEDLARACDVPSHPLRTQGDALEPFRLVAERARRFSKESGRDSIIGEVLSNGGKGLEKINMITAPSGWGKTTLLAELCRRYSKIVSVLSKTVLDQTEQVGAVYFFNKMDPSKSNSSLSCLRAISRQLSGTVPGFQLDEASLEQIDDPSLTITAMLEALICQPATALSSKGKAPTRRVLVVIDALDECEDFEQLQHALNAKWQSSPPWLVLICSCEAPRPQVVARHWEYDFEEKAVKSFGESLFCDTWGMGTAGSQLVRELVTRSQGNFLWLAICEPIIVSICEEEAALVSTDLASLLENALPAVISNERGNHQLLVERACQFIFERYKHQEDSERVRQSYSLAVCVPRSFLPVEIYSYCGIERIPPLLCIDDLCVKPLHGKVLDALLDCCGIRLDEIRDHALVSDALEKAYASDDGATTLMARRYASAHALFHARLAGRMDICRKWFDDFSKLYHSVTECVRETGDVLRMCQDGEESGIDEDIVDAIRLSNFSVSFDTREFPGQVIGRLGANLPLAIKAREFALSNLVDKHGYMTALPNPHFSGLSRVRGPLKKVFKHRAPVLCATESNGFVLSCSGAMGFIWDTRKTEKLGMLKGHTEDIRCCTFGTNIANAGSISFLAITGSADATCKVWQGQLKVALPGSSAPSPPAVVFSCMRTLTGHDSGVTCLAYKQTPQATYLISGSQDKTIIVWDFVSGLQLHRLRGHAGDVRSLCVVPDASLLLLSGSHDKTCRVWDLSQGGKEVGKMDGHSRDVSAVCTDGVKVYTGCFDGTARCYDLSTRKLLLEYKGHTQRINSAALSPNGQLLCTASYDNTARVFNTSTGEMLICLKGHANDVNNVRFAGSNDFVVTASLDCEMRLWSVSKDKIEKYQRESKARHEEQVTCVAAPNPNFACSGSSDGEARVWDLKSGACLAVLRGHDESLTSVGVSVDGRIAITGSEDGEVRVWSIDHQSQMGQELFSLQAHVDSIESVALSEDACFAKTVSFDKQVYVWDLSTGRTVVAGRNQGAAFMPSPSFKKQDSKHVLGPTGSSVGFTLDVSGFAVALVNEDESEKPKTFGELGDLFYLWDWHTKQ